MINFSVLRGCSVKKKKKKEEEELSQSATLR